jgi:aspartyl-tRNA(Asn)/glutamyl-tRNA(Gln) amidotransferase subunit A
MNDSQLVACIDDRTTRSSVSAVELTQAFLNHVAAAQPAINAFITVTPELALADARRIDAWRATGTRLPLDGMPLAVKDNIDVAGTRTTVGSKLFEHNVAVRDAEVVRRLRNAGAIILGKANMHELAYGPTSNNANFGAVRNPWDLSRIPGGSSGGSGAALAADQCIGALGSDTGGSIRIPASLTGVSGLRPTLGSVSNAGSFPLSWALDTIGPMARAVDDVFAILSVIAGFDLTDPRSVEPREFPAHGLLPGRLNGLRIGLPRDYFFAGLEPEVASSVRDAIEVFESLGAKAIDVEIPGAAEAWQSNNLIMRAEALALYEHRMKAAPGMIAPDIESRLQLGAEISGVELARCYQYMFEWRHTMRAAFGRVDIVLTPTVDRVAPPIAGGTMLETSVAVSRFTFPWSLAGLPALAVPSAPGANGLPAGVQLASPPWSEPLLYHAGEAFQRVTDWHRKRPPNHRSAALSLRSTSA